MNIETIEKINWISVEEKLPNRNDIVLIVAKNRYGVKYITTVRYMNIYWWIMQSHPSQEFYDKVLFWSPFLL